MRACTHMCARACMRSCMRACLHLCVRAPKSNCAILTNARPNLFMSKIPLLGRMWTNIGRNWAIRSGTSESRGRGGPMSVRVARNRPTWDKLTQTWLKSTKVGRAQPHLGQNDPNFGGHKPPGACLVRHRANFVEFWQHLQKTTPANVVERGPNLAEFAQSWPKSVEFGQSGLKLGKHPANVAGHGPKLSEFRDRQTYSAQTGANSDRPGRTRPSVNGSNTRRGRPKTPPYPTSRRAGERELIRMAALLLCCNARAPAPPPKERGGTSRHNERPPWVRRPLPGTLRAPSTWPPEGRPRSCAGAIEDGSPGRGRPPWNRRLARRPDGAAQRAESFV